MMPRRPRPGPAAAGHGRQRPACAPSRGAVPDTPNRRAGLRGGPTAQAAIATAMERRISAGHSNIMTALRARLPRGTERMVGGAGEGPASEGPMSRNTATHPSNLVLIDGAVFDGPYEGRLRRGTAAVWLARHAHDPRGRDGNPPRPRRRGRRLFPVRRRGGLAPAPGRGDRRRLSPGPHEDGPVRVRPAGLRVVGPDGRVPNQEPRRSRFPTPRAWSSAKRASTSSGWRLRRRRASTKAASPSSTQPSCDVCATRKSSVLPPSHAGSASGGPASTACSGKRRRRHSDLTQASRYLAAGVTNVGLAPHWGTRKHGANSSDNHSTT